MSAAVVAVGVAVGATLLVLNWPFTEAAVTKALEDRFARDVKIRKFRSSYFPPGCVAEGIEFLHRRRKDLPPLITVQTLTIRAGYSGLLRIHKQVNDVQVAGLHVLVPPKSPDAPRQTFPLTNSTSGKTLAIGEITTDGAVLEFISGQPVEDRFTLRIDHLTLDHVGESDPVTFHARFKNTEPPGEIRSDGRFGPWNDDDPASTELSGSYTYEHVKLGVFEGIAGTLSSQGKFSGTLGHIDAEGDFDVPDFKVSGSAHEVHLASNFHAVIDGTNGDTYLTRVESHFGRTTVISQGDVKGHPGQHGKTVMLSMSVSQGRIEDLLTPLHGFCAAGGDRRAAVADEGGVATRAAGILKTAPPGWRLRNWWWPLHRRQNPDAREPARRERARGDKEAGGSGSSDGAFESEGPLFGDRRGGEAF